MTDSIVERLRAVMKRSSRVQVDWSKVDAATRIDTIGFDSLTILDLIYDIQQEFKLDFEAEEVARIKTVGELAEFLARKQA